MTYLYGTPGFITLHDWPVSMDRESYLLLLEVGPRVWRLLQEEVEPNVVRIPESARYPLTSRGVR
jgi:hypothetical protein